MSKLNLLLRCSYYGVISAVVVVIFIAMFLLSPLATPLFRWSVGHFVPAIKLSNLSGSLYSSLIIKDVKYQSESMSLSTKHITAEINWSCSLRGRLCLESLDIIEPNLVLQTSDSSAEAAQSSKTTFIKSPLPILAPKVHISRLAVSNETVTLTVADSRADIQFSDKLSLQHVQSSNIYIENNMPLAPETPFAGLTYTPPEIPSIWVPVHLALSDVNTSSITYAQGQNQHSINTLNLQSASIVGSEIQWNGLDIKQENTSISTQGKLTLADHFPFEASAKASLSLSNSPKPQHLSITTAGSLYALILKAHLTGLVEGEAHLQVDLIDDDLPIDGRISWAQQSINYADIDTLNEGNALVDGTLAGYQLIVEASAVHKVIGDIAFTTDALLTKTQLNIEKLDAFLLDGELITSGKINFVDGLSALGTTNVNNIDASRFAPYAESATLPNASWDYVLQDSENGLIMLITDIGGGVALDHHAIQLTGQIAYYQDQDLAVANLHAKQPDSSNEITLLAQVLNKQKLSVNSAINLTTLSDINNEIEGDIKGNIKVEGSWSNPNFELQLKTNSLSFTEALSPFMHSQKFVTGAVSAQGNLEQHTITLSSETKDYAATFTSEGSFSTNYDYQGVIDKASLRVFATEWLADSAVPFHSNLHTFSSQISPHCWTLKNEDAKACLEQAQFSEDVANWTVNAASFPIGKWSTELLNSISTTSNSALFNAASAGSYSLKEGLNTTISLSIDESDWTFNPNNPVTLSLNEFNGEISLHNEELTSQWRVNSKNLGGVTAEFHSDNIAVMDSEIVGALHINHINLQPLSGLSPSIHGLEGYLNGELTVSGLTQKPSVLGTLALKDGFIDVEQSPLALSNWNQNINFSGHTADIQGSLGIGAGQGKIKGKLSWEDQPFAELNVDADDILITYEESKLEVSPHLNTIITPDGINVEGKVGVPYARIKLKQLPKSAVTPSKDVRIWGEEPSVDPLKNMTANITLYIDEKKTDEVKIDAFGLTANLQGDLNIENHPSLVGYGDLQLLNGRYKAYGQNLLIRTGEIQINGPISQPFLFVEAIRDPDDTDDDVVAGVRIDGSASSPNVTLFSEPTLEQGENLLYLINGSGSLTSGEDTDSVNYGALLLGLGLSQSGKLTNSIGNAVGIEDLTFSTSGQGSDTQVSLSGNLTRDLSVRIGVGVSQGQEVAIRYRILPQLYLEAVRQLSEAVSLIDVFYEFSLDDKPEKEKKAETEQ